MATKPNLPGNFRGSGSCPQYGERFYHRYKPPNCEYCNFPLGGSFVRKKAKTNETCHSKKAVLVTTLGDDVRIFSARTTPKNDRCFVTICGKSGQKICYCFKCLTERSACVNEGAGRSPSCEHITAAETSESDPVYKVDAFTDEDFSLQDATANMLMKMKEYNESQMPTVVKVDDSSYVTVAKASTEMEVGLCHIWFRRDSSVNSDRRFLKCASRSCKAPTMRSKKSRQPNLCVHLHLAILAQKIHEPQAEPQESEPDADNAPRPTGESASAASDNDNDNENSRQAAIAMVSKYSIPYEIPVDLLHHIDFTDIHKRWPDILAPEQNTCFCCQSQLGSAVLPNGHSRTDHGWYISNNNAFKKVVFLVKNCKNSSCKVVNNALPFEKGLFNVRNKVAVTFDILLEIRAMFKTGTPVSNIIEGKIDFLLLKTEKACRPPHGKISEIKKLLYHAFYTFEILTKRDLNNVICGLCGIVGEVYYGDGNEKICCRISEITELKQSESPGLQTTQSTEEILSPPSLDEFLEKIKFHLLEKCLFSHCAKKFETSMASIPSIIAPALLKENINTEKEKESIYLPKKDSKNIIGDPVLLSKFLKEHDLDLSKMASVGRPELEQICQYCKISFVGKSNDYLRSLIQKLYASIIVGNSPCHGFTKVEGRTGGFYHVVCRHGCNIASKFITLTESVRDAADIYLSLKCPPITFVCDTACTLVRHMNLREPELTGRLWGKFDGCFQEPKPGCTPDKDQNFPFVVTSEYRPVRKRNAKGNEDDLIHPVSGTSRRFVLGDRFHSTKNPHKSELCSFHDIDLCTQAATIRTSVQEARNKAKKDKRLRSATTQSFPVHFFFNYLMEYYQNERIVDEQKRRISKDGKKKITRDMFLRIVKLE